MALSDTEIKRAKARDRAYRISDGSGLFLWVTPPGGKLWRWGYVFEGKEKLMTFGKYPDVPLALARSRHAEARRLMATGTDPMAQRKADKTAKKIAAENSFASVATHWMEHWHQGKSPRHVESTRRRLSTNILPSLGAYPVAEIAAPDVVAMVKAIQDRGARDTRSVLLKQRARFFDLPSHMDTRSTTRPTRFDLVTSCKLHTESTTPGLMRRNCPIC
jgi:hypothetical protein